MTNMPSLKISQQERSGIEKISALNEWQFKAILTALKNALPSWNIEDLVKNLESEIENTDREDLVKILENIVSVYSLNKSSSLTPEELTNELIDGTGEPEGLSKFSKAEKEQFCQRLNDLLMPNNFLEAASKAKNVLKSQVELEAEFNKFAEEWRVETGMLSLVTQKSMHPAYQKIIGMGRPVVPWILRELERKPDHWFWALREITGDNPVKPEQRGRMKQMAQAWIEWGKERGYEW